ncbi:MAG: ISAs1 family transposase [Reichenbachiella sp.]
MEDPRSNIRNQVHYPLAEIFFLVISAVVSNMNDWDEIAMFGKEKTDWLRRFYPYAKGTPCDTTLSRFFAKVNPESFGQYFGKWTQSLHQVSEGKVVAIDGKTMRGSTDKANNKAALHIVSAFVSGQELCLGQLATDQKSNEITAIPELLDLLTLEGCIITIDAMGCQKAIAKKIIDSKADYILQVKNNQKNLLEQVGKVFGIASLASTSTSHTVDHGRIEERNCQVITDLTHLDDCQDWVGLKTIIRINSSRIQKQTGAIQTSTRYYISNREDDGEAFNKYIRSHWAIENNLHWSLDVTFKEDQSRKRIGNSAANFNIIAKMAMTLINNCTVKRKSKKLSKKHKRVKAAISDTFREQIMNI